MANEAENFVGQAGPATPVTVPNDVGEAGVTGIHENRDNQHFSAQIGLAGGAVTKADTPFSVVNGELNHSQFEPPQKPPDLTTKPREYGLFHLFKKKNETEIYKQRKELKNAA